VTDSAAERVQGVARKQFHIGCRRFGFLKAAPGVYLEDIKVVGMDFGYELAAAVKTHYLAERPVERTEYVYAYAPATWVQHLRRRLGWSYRSASIPVLVKIREELRYPKSTIPFSHCLGKGQMVVDIVAYTQIEDGDEERDQ